VLFCVAIFTRCRCEVDDEMHELAFVRYYKVLNRALDDTNCLQLKWEKRTLPNNRGKGPNYEVISVDWIQGTAFVVPKVGSCPIVGEERVFYLNRFML
jgi:hypothetical protein